MPEAMEANASPTTSMKDVVRIANLLREEGDRLLNSSCKLTLTVEFLAKLNEAFDLIVEDVDTSCFQVINTNNSSIEFLHDLQFLHDFVQKVSGLRLWNRMKIVESSVRLEKFRSLQYLDLHDVPVRNIMLSCLRDKLKYLNCTHCNLVDIKDLIMSGEDFTPKQENGLIPVELHWILLEEIFVSYNIVEVIASSLPYVPKLRLLDVSHNSLTDISALEQTTGNLEWLNISFNKVKSIPVVSKCAKLKVLLVNDNQLSDLIGLSKMPSLQQIDVSNNLLRDHSCLSHLSDLLRIEKLHLQGNPMAFKRGHRLLTFTHLNPLLFISGKLQLDGRTLSQMELSHLYSMEAYGTENVFNSELNENSFSHTNQDRPSTSEYQNITSNVPVTQRRSVKVGAPVGARQIRIREVSIADEEYFSNGRDDLDEESSIAPESAVHLETKRNIETLRKAAGEENWLRGGGGQKVLNLLGLPMKTVFAPLSIASTAVSLSPPSVVEPSLDQVVQPSDGNVESCEKAEEVQVEVMGESLMASNDEVGQEEENDMEHLKETEEKENGVELGVFVVQRGRVHHCDAMDDLLLRVTDRLLIECNVASGMEMARRTLHNLVAVSQEDVSEDEGRKSVHLTFRDSYSMEVLSYFMEDEESKELLKLIREMLEVRFSDSKEHALQFTCLRCSTTFVHGTSSDHSSVRLGKREGNMEGELNAPPKCPKCESVAVVQNLVEEAIEFPESSGVLPLQGITTPFTKDISSEYSEVKDPIAQWTAVNLMNEGQTDSEGLDHGLHLHILMNVLPDGQGKEFDLQKVLVFQGSSSEAFLGHIVIAADNVYILKEPVASEIDGRRFSGDEQNSPILAEQHNTESCLSVVKIYSGYLLTFGPETARAVVWVFPFHHKQMKEIMEALCSRLKEKQPLLDENQRINENSKLSGIIKFVPTTAITNLLGVCGPLECSLHDAEYGILVVTSSVMYFVNHKDMETFMFNQEYAPSYERRIADLVSVNGASSAGHQPNGITLHFSSEEHDDKCVVWPWGDGTILDILYSLQKPWENIFSVPFETILAQAASEGN